MIVTEATDPQAWDTFLHAQRFSPFLQSWTMGEVYAELKQKPIRLIATDGGVIRGICLALVVPARRGRHLSVPYGPVLADNNALVPLIDELKRIAREERCSFIRISPHLSSEHTAIFKNLRTKPAPLHLLAEHLWYLPLRAPDPWTSNAEDMQPRTEEELLKQMRSTTRNLIRRAEKEGVTIRAADNPVDELHHFLRLHDETRKRHGFTPYSDAFFRAQVAHFAPRNECTLYLAEYQGEVISASIHMHVGGETSYHHGASTQVHRKIPASYLLQWTAIRDALKRGDGIYNFWGTAPLHGENPRPQGANSQEKEDKGFNQKHPFAGVTLFKTGFGGKALNLMHCVDLPISPTYYVTRGFEVVRKWKRGF